MLFFKRHFWRRLTNIGKVTIAETRPSIKCEFYILINLLISHGCQSGLIGPGGPGDPGDPGGQRGHGGPGGQGGQGG